MRIRKIFVARLFGRFDYEIPMNLDERITIIHGPNGFGKTVLLRLIADLFSPANSTLYSVPYAQLQIDFENGESMSVQRIQKEKNGRSERGRANLRFTYRSGSKTNDFTLRSRQPEQLHIPLNLVDEIIPELEREGPELWRYQGTGELVSLEGVIERFGERIFTERPERPPEWLKAVRQSVPVRYIQAERLQAADRPSPSRMKHGKASASRAVKLYSDELGSIIRKTLTDYAALSQSLDRTFPARVVTHGTPLSMESLQTALVEMEAKRARLVEAGLLEQEGGEPTVRVPQHIDETKLAVLSVYVQDTDKKLSVFDRLAARIDLFKKSVNDRFLYKQLSVGKDGFGFTTTEGDPLNPINLSSGEQHEIVLLYELLFKAEENTLVLLDEPELSLHVAWQEQFLSDLRAITALSHFDALIATHSPQIISDRWDLTVELKGPQHEVLNHTKHPG